MSDGKLPEGCDCTLNIYMTSDSTGLEVKMAVKGLTLLPEFTEGPIEPFKLLASLGSGLGAGQGSLSEVASDWRVMTRAEISDYRRREHEDEL